MVIDNVTDVLSEFVFPNHHIIDGFRGLITSELSALLDRSPDSWLNNFSTIEAYINTLNASPQTSNNNQQNELTSAIKQARMLSVLDFTAALATTPFTDWDAHEQEQYQLYKCLIIFSTMQLSLIGNHGNAIEKALRQIRLFATNEKHRPAFKLLPEIGESTCLKTLAADLDQTRKDLLDKKTKFYIDYIAVAVSNAIEFKSGIIRTRQEKPLTDAQAPLPATVTSAYEGGVAYEEVTFDKPSTHGFDETDEPLALNNTKTLRITDKSLHNLSRAQKAIRSQRFSEQIYMRNLSLPCSVEHLSRWDIRNFLLTASDKAQLPEEQHVLADILLIMLFSGLRIEQLPNIRLWFSAKRQWLLIYEVPHLVPSGTQDPIIEPLISSPTHTVFRVPMPLITSLAIEQIVINDEVINQARTLLKVINNKYTTRLTLGRISNYLGHWYSCNGFDPAESAILRGLTAQQYAPIAYTHFNESNFLLNHQHYLKDIFSFAELSYDLPVIQQLPNTLGSAIKIKDHALKQLFKMLQPDPALKKRTALACMYEYHNQYTCYVWLLLAFSTGHRNVNAPLGSLADYNEHNGTWWISDKERRNGLSARTVVLPKTAALQVQLYLQHIQTLVKKTRLLADNISLHCQQVLNKQSNLLFFIDSPSTQAAQAVGLTPSVLKQVLKHTVPFQYNWPRHHLRTHLKNKNIHYELINSWMGHEDFGEEGLGSFSSLSLHDFTQICDQIELLLNELNVQAITGWS